jgi:TatA/E family protein of Tat protein translocase
VLFGARRIPEIMRGFGEGIREFKSASQKAMDEIDQATKVEPAKPAVKAAAPAPEDSPKIEP